MKALRHDNMTCAFCVIQFDFSFGTIEKLWWIVDGKGGHIGDPFKQNEQERN